MIEPSGKSRLNCFKRLMSASEAAASENSTGSPPPLSTRCTRNP